MSANAEDSGKRGWVDRQLHALVERGELHALLLCGTQESVVRAMINENPAAAQIRKGNGELPLHAAVCHGATQGTVQALLSAHRDGARVRDSSGNLPLHIALRKGAKDEVLFALIGAYPGAVAAADVEGEFPAHLAMQRASEAVMRAIVAACPYIAAATNRHGFQPIQYARSARLSLAFLEMALHQGVFHQLSSPRSLLAIAARFADLDSLCGLFSVVEAGLTTSPNFSIAASALVRVAQANNRGETSEVLEDDDSEDDSDDGWRQDDDQLSVKDVQRCGRVHASRSVRLVSPTLMLRTLRRWRHGAKLWREFFERSLSQAIPQPCTSRIVDFLYCA